MMAMFVSHLQCFSAEEVLSGADMTPEASFAKLSYILGQQNLSQTQRKEVSMVLYIILVKVSNSAVGKIGFHV